MEIILVYHVVPILGLTLYLLSKTRHIPCTTPPAYNLENEVEIMPIMSGIQERYLALGEYIIKGFKKHGMLGKAPLRKWGRGIKKVAFGFCHILNVKSCPNMKYEQLKQRDLKCISGLEFCGHH